MRAIVMRSHNKLMIRGSEPEMAQLLKRFEGPPIEGWQRNAAAESRMRSSGIRSEGTYCLTCSANERRRPASLWLHSRGSGEISVSDIVSMDKRGLSDHECNFILADFESAIHKAKGDGSTVVTEIVPHVVRLESYLLSEAIRRLNAFSLCAENKQVLNSKDRRRWHEFIIETHLEGAELDTSVLDQWLAEHGWAEEMRRELLFEYADHRSVLWAYDEERLEKCLR
jgi:hypothetical protein